MCQSLCMQQADFCVVLLYPKLTSGGIMCCQTPGRVHHHSVKLLLLYEALPVEVDDVGVYWYAVLRHLPEAAVHHPAWVDHIVDAFIPLSPSPGYVPGSEMRLQQLVHY